MPEACTFLEELLVYIGWLSDTAPDQLADWARVMAEQMFPSDPSTRC